LDVLFDYEGLRAKLDRDALHNQTEQSMWRYKAMLPIEPESPVPPLRVGMTPLYTTKRLADDLGLRRVWLKDDGQNPTGSFKDRASAMVVARAMEQGIATVSTASTGNAAAALAGVGASVGLNTIIFVPATAPEAKLAQLLVYGATVLLVEGAYDVAFDLCYQMCMSEGWYCRNTAINPYTTEGKKTGAYEIAEQLAWNVPNVVMVSVGDGNIIAGLYKGFYDLLQLGWIERIPRLIGVQAEGSSSLVHAWKNNIRAEDMQPMPAETIADSISAGLPRDRAKALRAVWETNGAFVAVPDVEILAAIPKVARLTGVFPEPSCAAVYAGAKRAVQSKLIAADEMIVFVMTGNGLKDIRRAQESVARGTPVKPSIDSIKHALRIGAR
jgi:threonine synthase